jgi:phenylacetate-CoA ligase
VNASPPGFELPAVRSGIEGVAWPGIAADSAAQLLAMNFQLDHSQWWSPEQLRAQQLTQLRLLLRHALDSVPYFSRTFEGLDVRHMDWEAFERLPLLDRRTLQAEFEALSSHRLPPSHGAVSVAESSGSTGMPIKFRTTVLSQFFWEALTLREHLWHRRDFTGKLAAIRVQVDDASLPDWGAPAGSVFRTGPSAVLNVRADVDTQLAWLQREDPDYLISHASNLGALAEQSLRRGLRLPRLRQARTLSETLRPDLRETVRAAWGVEVVDTYSCSEAGVIALQCPLHEHYHVQSENLVVELLRPDGSACGVGETGEVVLTTLHNFALPLIRYRIGDYAEAGEACSCGRGLPVLKRILGRQRNMARLPDGRTLWPSFPAAVWRSVVPVDQFQLVQREPDLIEARFVMEREMSPDEVVRLTLLLQQRLGFPFRIEPTRVARIERPAAHKFEDFICALPPAEARSSGG